MYSKPIMVIASCLQGIVKEQRPEPFRAVYSLGGSYWFKDNIFFNPDPIGLKGRRIVQHGRKDLGSSFKMNMTTKRKRNKMGI